MALSFAEKLYALRTIHGLTQAQAAKLANVSKRALEHWEAGERTPPAEKAAVTQERVLAAIMRANASDEPWPL